MRAVALSCLMRPCPNRPNCVSSRAPPGDRAHVAALPLPPGPGGFQAVRAAVERLPRTRIVEATAGSLRAECRSRLAGFVDDLELEASPETGLVHVRSAARTGFWDLGVNRRRLERLRRMIAGLIG